MFRLTSLWSLRKLWNPHPFSSISAVLCVKDSSPRARPSIKCPTATFWGVLMGDVWRKRSDLWSAKNWILHNDNCTCHRTFLTRDFLAQNNIESLPNMAFIRFITCGLPYLLRAENASRRSPLPRSRVNSRRSSICLWKTTSRPDSKSGKWDHCWSWSLFKIDNVKT